MSDLTSNPVAAEARKSAVVCRRLEMHANADEWEKAADEIDRLTAELKLKATANSYLEHQLAGLRATLEGKNPPEAREVPAEIRLWHALTHIEDKQKALLIALNAIEEAYSLTGPGRIERVLEKALNDLHRMAPPKHPHEPQGVLDLVKQKRDEYRSFLDNGKGTWPGSDYIQDETWARWQGAWSVLDSIVSQAEREMPCLFDKLVGNPLDGFPSTKSGDPT